jgi:hypothetical protein
LQNPSDVFALADELVGHPEGVEAIPGLLLLLEQNEKLEWGAPGPVVHAVETFCGRGYERLLLESIRRKPTNHTLWMVNRVLNGVSKDLQSDFMEVLAKAAKRKDVSAEVRQAATGFLEFQRTCK